MVHVRARRPRPRRTAMNDELDVVLVEERDAEGKERKRAEIVFGVQREISGSSVLLHIHPSHDPGGPSAARCRFKVEQALRRHMRPACIARGHHEREIRTEEQARREGRDHERRASFVPGEVVRAGRERRRGVFNIQLKRILNDEPQRDRRFAEPGTYPNWPGACLRGSPGFGRYSREREKKV